MKHRMVIAVAALLPLCTASAEPPQQTQPSPPLRQFAAFYAAAAYWEDAKSLSPAPTDFITEQSGRFKSEGYGFVLSYHRRLERTGRVRLFVGGDFAGYINANDRSAFGFNAVTKEPSRIKLLANWGYLTGSARFVWREGRRSEIHAGAGLGLYLLRIKESVEEFGVADRFESDATPGAHLSLGMRFPYKATAFGFRLDGKIHVVSFDNLGGAFADQNAGGPIYSLEFGGDWGW